MISFRHKGDFSDFTKFLDKLKNMKIEKVIERYGREGVAALASATPTETGLTASSWYYQVERQNGKITINFCNRHVNDGVPIAVILQYGHGTRNGGWVRGRDYINPAIRPVFDKLADDAWKEVTKI